MRFDSAISDVDRAFESAVEDALLDIFRKGEIVNDTSFRAVVADVVRATS